MLQKMQLQVMIIPFLVNILLARGGLAGTCQLKRPTQRAKMFQKLPSLDSFEVTQTAPLSVVRPVRSVLSCSQRCVGVAGCVMVTFLANQSGRWGDCQMHGQVATPTTPRSPSPGAVSFAINDSLMCTNGYSMTCGMCLHFVPTKMNYTQAGQYCRQLGHGHLGVIKTQQGLECVGDKFGIVRNISIYLWLGLDDYAVAGCYVWADGSCLPTSSALWGSGQPNQLHVQERCIVYRSHDKRLHDHYCHWQFYVMCQRDL